MEKMWPTPMYICTYVSIHINIYEETLKIHTSVHMYVHTNSCILLKVVMKRFVEPA